MWECVCACECVEFRADIDLVESLVAHHSLPGQDLVALLLSSPGVCIFGFTLIFGGFAWCVNFGVYVSFLEGFKILGMGV